MILEPPEFRRGPRPLYAQVADAIAAAIADGRLEADDRLPSERDLAREWGVAYDTVRRAMEELRDRGLIVTVHGLGTYVKEPPPPDDER